MSASISSRIKTLHIRFGKFGYALADQALFAGSNFLLNVLLANWMSKSEYGAFAIAYTWFLLLQIFYDSLLINPLSYYGAGKYSHSFKAYVGMIYRGHLVVGLVIAAGMYALSSIVTQTGTPQLGAALFGAAIAAPFMLLRGLLRQPFYIQSKPQWSAFGGVVYLIVNLGVAYALHEYQVLTSYTAFLGMGASWLLTGVIVTVFILRPQLYTRESDLKMRALLQDHWTQGKWALSSNLLSWVSNNFGILYIPLLVGLSGSATLRATLNLVQPIFQINMALGALLTPIFVRTYQNQGRDALDSKLKRYLGIITLITGGYFLFLTVFGQSLIHWLYAGKYDADVSLIYVMLLGLIPIVTTISRTFDAGLNAMGKIRLSFQSKIIPTLLTIILDTVLMGALGAIGFIIESLITSSLTLARLMVFYRQQRMQPQPSPSPTTLKNNDPVDFPTDDFPTKTLI